MRPNLTVLVIIRSCNKLCLYCSCAYCRDGISITVYPFVSFHFVNKPLTGTGVICSQQMFFVIRTFVLVLTLWWMWIVSMLLWFLEVEVVIRWIWIVPSVILRRWWVVGIWVVASISRPRYNCCIIDNWDRRSWCRHVNNSVRWWCRCWMKIKI